LKDVDVVAATQAMMHLRTKMVATARAVRLNMTKVASVTHLVGNLNQNRGIVELHLVGNNEMSLFGSQTESNVDWVYSCWMLVCNLWVHSGWMLVGNLWVHSGLMLVGNLWVHSCWMLVGNLCWNKVGLT
jgi:hypothetical protein